MAEGVMAEGGAEAEVEVEDGDAGLTRRLA